MLEFGVRITCGRCGKEDEYFKHYERRYENEIINQMRHHFFRQLNEDGYKDTWREMPLDDLQYLCPACNKELQKINAKHQKHINDWIQEAKDEMV